MKRKSKGYGMAALVFLLLAGLGYLMLYKPASTGLAAGKEGVVKLTAEVEEASTLRIEANSTTAAIGKGAIETGIKDILEKVSRAGVPDSAVRVSNRKVKIIYTDRPMKIGSAVTGMIGSPFIDTTGQLQGEHEVFSFTFKVKSAGSRSTLEATIAPPTR